MSGIKIPIANINSVMSRNFVKQMASEGFLPVIALEAFVEGGRTYQAYNRGGFDEARERITEEFTGAVFWLGGVTGLNWLFEKLGQRFLHLPKKIVDSASDEVRNPIDNFLLYERKTNKTADKITKEFISKFKFVKVISSIVIANAFIGFALPKINQAITRKYHEKDNLKKQQTLENNTSAGINSNKNTTQKIASIKDFGNDKTDNKNVSFGALNLLAIANKFENDRNCRLLAVDAGTASGRAISARNNDERIEILFRDLSSIFFYMFNMSMINKWFNKMQQNGVSTRLDPVCAEFASQFMQANMDDKMSIDKFKAKFLGKESELPEGLKTHFKDKSIKTITLEGFKEELKGAIKNQAKYKSLCNLADEMSKLQPTIKGISILTEGQVRAILDGGLINNPEFIREFLKTGFGKKFMNQYKFIAQNDIDTKLRDLKIYVNSIIADAQKTELKEVTHKILMKASRKNLKINAFNWGTGFVISAAFLSTIIPKLQYLITKLRTGQNAFPGTAQYREQENKG